MSEIDELYKRIEELNEELNQEFKASARLREELAGWRKTAPIIKHQSDKDTSTIATLQAAVDAAKKVIDSLPAMDYESERAKYAWLDAYAEKEKA